MWIEKKYVQDMTLSIKCGCVSFKISFVYLNTSSVSLRVVEKHSVLHSILTKAARIFAVSKIEDRRLGVSSAGMAL